MPKPDFSEIDWSKFTKITDLDPLFKQYDPRLVRAARKFSLPDAVIDLLARFGMRDLPKDWWDLRRNEAGAELKVSDDGTVLGYEADDLGRLCGVYITPGDAGHIATKRAPVALTEGDSQHHAYVPEGRYQIVLVTPPPSYDPNTKKVTYYTAQALVRAEAGESGDVVTGDMSAFTSNGKPKSWLVLNQIDLRRQARLAYRHIPGISFPKVPGDDTAPVLGLYSLANQRREDIPEGVVSGSGLVAVQFIRNRQHIEPTVARESRQPIWSNLQSEFAPARSMPPMRFGVDTTGTTVFELQNATALHTERGGGEFEIVGRPILLSVTSNPAVATDPVLTNGSQLIEHRLPTDEAPLADALERWGVLSPPQAATLRLQRG